MLADPPGIGPKCEPAPRPPNEATRTPPHVGTERILRPHQSARDARDARDAHTRDPDFNLCGVSICMSATGGVATAHG